MPQNIQAVLDETAIASQRDAILQSDEFARSARSRDLFRYVVDEALAGRGAWISATTIAQDVLGKGDDFDAGVDPLVRVQMGRMRAVLSAWYEGRAAVAAVLIEVPKGTYEPRFSWMGPNATSSDGDRSVTATPTEAPSAPAPAARTTPPMPPARAAERFWLRPGHLVTIALGLCLVVASVVALLPKPAVPARAYPIVVVRPFENLTGDASNDVLAASLQRQLAADLQRFKTVRVAVDGTATSPRPIPRRRGVRKRETPPMPDYAVTGAVLSATDTLDFTLDLIDLGSGALVSRERYGGVVTGDYFALVADLSRSASGVILGSGGALGRAELDQLEDAVALPANGELSAFRCLGLFDVFMNFKTPDGARAAYDCLDLAVDAHPADSTLLGALAWITALIAPGTGLLDAGDWTEGLSLDQARSLAERAVQIGPGDDSAHEFLGLIQWRLGETDSGLDSMRRAVALNPGNPHLLADLGLHLAFAGEWEEAEAYTTLAFERSGNPPGWYSLTAAFDAMLNGNGAAAQRLIAIAAPGDPYGDIYTLVAAVIAGDEAGVAAARPGVDRIAQRYGGDPLADLRYWIRSPQIVGMLEENLADAGFDTVAD